MKRVRNFFHALIGLAAIAVAGWLLAQPWMSKGLHQHPGERAAAAALVCALILFVLVSLYRAIRPGKPAATARRAGLPYAFGTRKR